MVFDEFKIVGKSRFDKPAPHIGINEQPILCAEIIPSQNDIDLSFCCSEYSFEINEIEFPDFSENCLGNLISRHKIDEDLFTTA